MRDSIVDTCLLILYLYLCIANLLYFLKVEILYYFVVCVFCRFSTIGFIVIIIVSFFVCCLWIHATIVYWGVVFIFCYIIIWWLYYFWIGYIIYRSFFLFFSQFVAEQKRNSVHIVKFLRKIKKAKSLNYFTTDLKYHSHER